MQYFSTHNLGFPAISGIEGGGNAILSSYGISVFPTYILIAPNHDIVEQDMWPITNTQTFTDYFESNGLEQSPCSPPPCTQALYPPDLSGNIPLDLAIEWEPLADATGYLLYFGTDNPPTSIENGTDLGNTTTYTPPASLDYETDYYWQIVPYNNAGTAISCQVFQFTTIIHTITLDLTVFLEGPYSGGGMTPSLNSSGFLPLNQPYNTFPWYYQGTESVESFPGSVVDWVLIDILKPYDSWNGLKFELISRKAGFIVKDGTIKDLSGVNNISFDFSVPVFHVRVQHRNHLPVVSSAPLTGINDIYIYDFTSGIDQALGGKFAQKEVEPGKWAMIGADGNSDKQIDNDDKNEIWFFQEGMTGYLKGDFNMDTDVNENDKTVPWELNTGRAAYPVYDTIPAK